MNQTNDIDNLNIDNLNNQRLFEIPPDILNLDNFNNIPPNLLKQARKFANTKAGREMLKELDDKGINRESIQKTLLPQKNIGELKSVIIIRPNGCIKTKLIDINDLTDKGPTLLHAVFPVKLIYNSLTKKNLIVWYDNINKYTNKKASKMIGTTVGGLVIIYSPDSNIQLHDL